MPTALLLLLLTLGSGAPGPRARAQAVLDAAGDARSRACAAVTLPADAEVSAPYTVELLAEYGEWVPSASILEIDRTADGAVVRWTTAAGRRERTLDRAQLGALDGWASVAVLLVGARTKSLALCLDNVGFASHVASRTITVRSGGRELLRTAPTQPIHDDLADGLPAFAATWTTEHLESMVEGWLHGITPVPIAAPEAKRRLAALPTRARAKGRAAIESRLLAAALGSADDRSAVALLRRKGFDEDALRLDLRTTALAELGDRLAPLLCDSEWTVRTTATAELPRLGSSARAPLIHAASCKLDEYAQLDVLERLAALGTDAATSRIVAAATASTRPLRVQVAARALRFAEAAGEDDLVFLETAAAGDPSTLLDMRDEQTYALEALGRIAAGNAALRDRIAALFARLLARIPMSAHSTYSGMAHLVALLGRLDAQKYEAEIRRVLAHDDASVVVAAIEALERVDVDAAASAAIDRIRLYEQGKTTGAGYSWNVLPYLGLLIRVDARKALPVLRRALVRLEAGDEAEPWKTGSHRALIQYLAVAEDRDRAAAGLEFVRANGPPDAALRGFLIERWRGHGVDAAAIDAAAVEFQRRAATWRP